MPIIIIPPRTNPSGSGGGSGGVSVHNDLTGIQGGIVGSYYHSNQSLNTTDNVAFNRVGVADTIQIGNYTLPTDTGLINQQLTSGGDGTVAWASGGITSHNDLTGKQGGDTGAYYHSNQGINTSDNVVFNRVGVGDTLQVGNYYLPATSGTAGQTLVNNGSGVVTWGSGISTFSTYGTTGSVLFIGSGNSIGEDNFAFNYDYTKRILQLRDANENIKIGYQAGYDYNTPTVNSIILGSQAGYEGNTRSILQGYQAGYHIIGTDNLALGYQSLLSYKAPVTTSMRITSVGNSGKYARTVDNAIADISSQDYTFAGWFNLATRQTYNNIVDSNYRWSNPILRVAIGDVTANKLVVYHSNSSGVYVEHPSTISADIWYFLTIKRTNDPLVLSVQINNGTATTGVTNNLSGASQSYETTFSPGGWSANARYASWGFWKRILSASEITSLYNLGNGVLYSTLDSSIKTNLIGWWNMLDASGPRLDSSGNSYHISNFNPAGVATLENIGIPAATTTPASTVSNNIAIGASTLYSDLTGNNNIAIGNLSGYGNTTGSNNTFLGNSSGYLATGSSNVFLGHNAGYYETGSSKLYIANSSTTNPLIYGDFSTGRIGIGSSLPQASFTVNNDTRLLGTVGIGTTTMSSPLYIYSQLATPNATVGITTNINWNMGMIQTLDLQGYGTTIGIGMANQIDGANYVLILIQGNPYVQTINWPTTVKWSGGVAPGITTTNDAEDFITFTYANSKYYGNYGQNYV